MQSFNLINLLSIVFSCSNDTTIKLWQLNKVYYQEYRQENENQAVSIQSLLTLNEDFDYVRAIDFSSYSKCLFSASDNGIVKKWDMNVGGIINEQHLPLEVRVHAYS